MIWNVKQREKEEELRKIKITLFLYSVNVSKALQNADSFVVLCFAKYQTLPVSKLSKWSKLIRSFIYRKIFTKPNENIRKTVLALKHTFLAFKDTFLAFKDTFLALKCTFLALKCTFLALKWMFLAYNVQFCLKMFVFK